MVLYRRGMLIRELLHRFGAAQNWFNASWTGCGDEGHDFWSRTKMDSNRTALVEYLKTLWGDEETFRAGFCTSSCRNSTGRSLGRRTERR